MLGRAGAEGGCEGWAGEGADINDLQPAAKIGNEGGVAIGRESDVIGNARGVEVGGEAWAGEGADINDRQAAALISDEGGVAVG